jgi:protein-L-isoaspartate(D-aspartate) O-methyltransferase
MDVFAPDFSDARQRMIDGQLRPNKVTDQRILEAMRTLPREDFLPPELASFAYIDEDVPLGNGRFLMEPLVLARLVQLAAPKAGECALVVGAGVGYGAAVLAACGANVTALEENPDLLARARAVLAIHAPSVRVVHGPLAEGWPSGAPWDVILIEGAVAEVPSTIAGQLRLERGRLVTVLRRPAERIGRGILAEATVEGIAARPMFDCATPYLPQFQPKQHFVF